MARAQRSQGRQGPLQTALMGQAMGWTVGVLHCLGHPNILLLQQWLTWSPEVAADLCLAPFQVWKQRAQRRYIVKSGKLILVSEGPPHPQPGSGGGHFLQFHPWDLGCGPGKEGAEMAKESADRVGRELSTVSPHHPEKVAMCTIYVVDEHLMRAGCMPDKRNLTRSHPAKGQADWSVSWSQGAHEVPNSVPGTPDPDRRGAVLPASFQGPCLLLTQAPVHRAPEGLRQSQSFAWEIFSSYILSVSMLTLG